MALLTLIEPASEPVTRDEMKLFLRVDSDNAQDDALLDSLIVASRRWCEVYTQRRFVYQTIRLLMDFFPGTIDQRLAGQRVSSPFVSGQNSVLVGIRYAIALPYPPVRSIKLFQYQDANGGTIVLAPVTDYIQDLASQPARLLPTIARSFWPVARVIANAVQVDYVVGYGGNIAVGMTQGSALITGPTFSASDVGLPLTVPGAGAAAAALVTSILSVDGAGVGTAAVNASTTVTGATAYLGQPVPELIKTAIKLLVDHWYENRTPSDVDVPRAVKSLLSPYRDLRL